MAGALSKKLTGMKRPHAVLWCYDAMCFIFFPRKVHNSTVGSMDSFLHPWYWRSLWVNLLDNWPCPYQIIICYQITLCCWRCGAIAVSGRMLVCFCRGRREWKGRCHLWHLPITFLAPCVHTDLLMGSAQPTPRGWHSLLIFSLVQGNLEGLSANSSKVWSSKV